MSLVYVQLVRSGRLNYLWHYLLPASEINQADTVGSIVLSLVVDRSEVSNIKVRHRFFVADFQNPSCVAECLRRYIVDWDGSDGYVPLPGAEDCGETSLVVRIMPYTDPCETMPMLREDLPWEAFVSLFQVSGKAT